MPALCAVLFDFFGTLTEAVTRGPAHAAIARRLGCDPADFARALDRSFLTRARGGLGSAEQALHTLARGLGGTPSPATLHAMADERVAAVRADTRLRPETVPVLRGLRARGLRLGLISDCGPELPDFLPGLPIAELLDATVFSIEVGACKPDPALYLAACDRLEVAPDECLYVGDGGSRELTGAAAVGMHAVKLAAPDLGGHLGFNHDTDWAGPTVRSLAEVPALAAAVDSLAGLPALASTAGSLAELRALVAAADR
jgi:putative hydrolase of the HAD superfamily